MKIKMSARTAKRILSQKSVSIFVEKASSYFVTEPGIRQDQTVSVPHENIFVPLEDIARIAFEDRFGTLSEMEVDWSL